MSAGPARGLQPINQQRRLEQRGLNSGSEVTKYRSRKNPLPLHEGPREGTHKFGTRLMAARWVIGAESGGRRVLALAAMTLAAAVGF